MAGEPAASLACAVSGLAAALDKADVEVSRLKEWQDVFKRMADDKAQEAAQELQAFKTHAAERQVATAGVHTAQHTYPEYTRLLGLVCRLLTRVSAVHTSQEVLSVLLQASYPRYKSACMHAMLKSQACSKS
jgi:hypothetical protein